MQDQAFAPPLKFTGEDGFSQIVIRLVSQALVSAIRTTALASDPIGDAPKPDPLPAASLTFTKSEDLPSAAAAAGNETRCGHKSPLRDAHSGNCRGTRVRFRLLRSVA